uniref:hypothetical protein n=1 Tax=Klebsiella pneumoniae TaxID=573 RepID=UPI00163D57F4
KPLKPISEPLKKLTEEGILQFNDRKRKTKMELTETPLKRYLPAPPQGVKRKNKINLPTHIDFESDYEYDDGTTDLPIPKRLATSPDHTMETQDIEENEEIDQEMFEQPASTSSFSEQIYESPMTGEELIKTPAGQNLAKEYIQSQF